MPKQKTTKKKKEQNNYLFEKLYQYIYKEKDSDPDDDEREDDEELWMASVKEILVQLGWNFIRSNDRSESNLNLNKLNENTKETISENIESEYDEETLIINNMIKDWRKEQLSFDAFSNVVQEAIEYENWKSEIRVVFDMLSHSKETFTINDMKELLIQIGEDISDEEVKDMFILIDEKRTGKITKDQFIACMKNLEKILMKMECGNLNLISTATLVDVVNEEESILKKRWEGCNWIQDEIEKYGMNIFLASVSWSF